jgi:hypothetical protein
MDTVRYLAGIEKPLSVRSNAPGEQVIAKIECGTVETSLWYMDAFKV